MTPEKALVAVLMTIGTGLFAALVALGAAGFFDAVPAHGPQPCSAAWRADCETVTR